MVPVFGTSENQQSWLSTNISTKPKYKNMLIEQHTILINKNKMYKTDTLYIYPLFKIVFQIFSQTELWEVKKKQKKSC